MAISSEKTNFRLSCFVRTVQSNRGFTFIEMLIAMTIVAILATMIIVAFADFKEKARVSRTASEIRGLEKEIIAYATEQGRFPASLEQIGRQNLLDPWGSPYEYYDTSSLIRINVGSPINTDFDLYSKGADGETDNSIVHAKSLDDIIRATDGAFCNSASKFFLL